METEVQHLRVYNKGILCIIGKDYNIINREVIFIKPIQRKNVTVRWEIINQEVKNV